MPLYEYECECGERFEKRRSIAERYLVRCDACGKTPKLRISAWGRVLVAAPFTVVGHDGTILDRRQTTERTALLGVEEP